MKYNFSTIKSKKNNLAGTVRLIGCSLLQNISLYTHEEIVLEI